MEEMNDALSVGYIVRDATHVLELDLQPGVALSTRSLTRGAPATMSPLRDEELIRDPAIRRAVEAHHAATSQPAPSRSRRQLIGWLLVGMATCVLLIVLIGLIRLGG